MSYLLQSILFPIILCSLIQAQTITEMVRIEAGEFKPLYGLDSSNVQIEPFYIDVYPVTNQQFKEFLVDHEKWTKSNVLALFANEGYLASWDTDFTYGTLDSSSPVNSISWFVANKYCECLDKRLPTTDEWEYVAMADETRKDAREDSLYTMKILGGYETPKTNIRTIGYSAPNYWGVYDLHSIVWEWTHDFNAVLISGESRKDGDVDRNLFCAGGAVGVTDLMNYAAFMRYAFRGSLKANFCIRNLGFRCASSEPLNN